MRRFALKVSLAALTLFVSAAVHADGTPRPPNAVIVRESRDGIREVYKAELEQPIKDADAAKAAADAFVKPENRVANVKTPGELDRVTSDEAWFHWYNPYYYRGYGTPYYYGASWYGNFYYYYPTYSWAPYYGSYYYPYSYYYYWW